MHFGERLVAKSVDRYRTVTAVAAGATLVLALAAGLPSLLPRPLGFLHRVEVDTDPENMLSSDEPVRVYNDAMKKRLALHDLVVVGVVNDADGDGVFNPSSLAKVHALVDFARRLDGGDGSTPLQADSPAARYGFRPGERVIAPDIIAPSTVDNIVPSKGALQFEWLMLKPPADANAARRVLADARRIPFFRGSMVPQNDDRAVAIYLPISSKDISSKVYGALRDKTAELGGPERYYVTGLPVAEDVFGVEMFVQMAISAPAAMLVIFVLMFVFFRKLALIVSPMLVALMSVTITMGGLIVAGFPIHIMSSMIPIFIMPIAVLDSIHIISEFFEKYQATRDRRRTILAVMDELYMPMLYTSLTSAAGFASLALTPIPPVQVFGLFVAAGVMVAWVLTVTFVPAFVMFIPDRTLANFGAKFDPHKGREEAVTRLGKFLQHVGAGTYRWAKPIVVAAGVVFVAAVWGITRININDNPIKWFTPGHFIRESDRVLNEHLAGTYMAYLALEAPSPGEFDPNAYAAALGERAWARAKTIAAIASGDAARAIPGAAAHAESLDAFFEKLKAAVQVNIDKADDNELSASTAVQAFLDREWDRRSFATPPVKFEKDKTPQFIGERLDAFASAVDERFVRLGRAADRLAAERPPTEAAFLERLAARDKPAAADPVIAAAATEAVKSFLAESAYLGEVFKRPEVLEWMKRLKTAMAGVTDGGRPLVGKCNSLVEIVETVNRDLHDGNETYYRIPPTRKAVGSCLTQFTSSHRPQDLWHFVTSDYRTASLWVQLRSGDNRDMAAVVAAVDRFAAANPAPAGLRHRWFGLTYINVVWQDKMVAGMLESFAGSFLVVLFLMVVLFRSALWGLLSMIPLTVTIAGIYGAIGILGVDYDMPIAVLSSLTLGLAVDFAIHFLARGRELHARLGGWRAAAPAVFGEPARAISRNIIVIAAGFLPLLLAPLVPYKTVGVFLATILLVSGAGTLLILPALVRLLERRLFRREGETSFACKCGTCVAAAAALVGVAAINLYQYFRVGTNVLVPGAIAGVVLAAVACRVLSRRAACAAPAQTEERSTDEHG